MLDVVGEHLADVDDVACARPSHRPADESTRTCTADMPSSEGPFVSTICGESKSSASISITEVRIRRAERRNTASRHRRRQNVVSIAAGDESRTAAHTRSSSAPNCGTGSGTAMKPACIAPKKATM